MLGYNTRSLYAYRSSGKTWIAVLLSAVCSLNVFAASDSTEKNILFASTQNAIESFHIVLRDFDLNNETEDGYSISSEEYNHLLLMWRWMSPSQRADLLQGNQGYCWQHTLTLPLLYSLNAGKTWTGFISDMEKYDVRGVALTISRSTTPVSLETAHQSLLDCLYEGIKLFKRGNLQISEKIKSTAEKRVGKEARERLEHWEKLINSNQQVSDIDKLWLVNGFFNCTIQTRADDTNTDTYDYWQSPLETLIRGIGDCEDFALAKYFSLRLLGIPTDRLLITMVYHPAYSQMHGVLAYYPSEKKDPYILDNIRFYHLGQKGNHIVPMSMRIQTDRLKPLWAINEDEFLEYQNGLKVKSIERNPQQKIPRFWIAWVNSRCLIPGRS